MEPMYGFDRSFAAMDLVRFKTFTAGIVGQPCVTWRTSYNLWGSLHFGILVPDQHPFPRQVHRTRGQWVVWLRDCERRLTLPDKTVHDSLLGGVDSISSQLGSLVGDTLTGLILEPADLSLRLDFASGTALELPPDPLLGSDAEQWAIQTSLSGWISVYGGRRWVYEPPPGNGE